MRLKPDKIYLTIPLHWSTRMVLWLAALMLLLGLPATSAPALAAYPTWIPAQEADCESLIKAIQAGNDWQDRLIDPILTEPKQVDAHLSLMTNVHDCLEGQTTSLSPEERKIYLLSEYFMIFAGGYGTPDGQSILYLVDLATSDDPAVMELRNEARLAPPQGFIYVRFYPTRLAMPPLLQQSFEDSQVSGVTIFTRYIAILDEKKITVGEQILQAQTLPETRSHELVHAYVNSALGANRFASMPTWYHEGIATYFSGSGESHRFEMPGMTVSQTAPEDYQQYDLNFKYLQAEHGRERLMALIHLSIQQADETVLFSGLDVANEEQLAQQALDWRARLIRRRGMIAMGLAVLAFMGLLSLSPTIRCPGCDFRGRRGAFEGERCPNCRRPVHVPPTMAHRLSMVLTSTWRLLQGQHTRVDQSSNLAQGPQITQLPKPDTGISCEICGRDFRGQMTGQVLHWPYRVRVWTDRQDGDTLGTAREVYVNSACRDCLERSMELRDLRRGV